MSRVLKTVVSTLVGAAIGVVGGVLATDKKTAKVQQMSNKHFELFKMMNEWVRVKQEGKNLSSYFESNGYKKIAIYGMSYAGERLVDELKNSSVTIAYGIDQRADNLYAEVDIVTMDDKLEEVDAIVVTAITFFDEIEEKLVEKIDCPIISLEDILYEV